MNTTYISFRTDDNLKTQVQAIAKGLGVTIADLVNSYLKQLVKNKSIASKFSENPTPYLLKSIEIARKERKQGKVSPVFDNPKDAIKWLNS